VTGFLPLQRKKKEKFLPKVLWWNPHYGLVGGISFHFDGEGTFKSPTRLNDVDVGRSDPILKS
jgi:hypothetical protein